MISYQRRKLSIIFLIALFFFTSSCVQLGKIKMMQETSSNLIMPSPSNEKALVVFIRPKDELYGMQADILNVTGGNIELVGILASGTRVAYQVDPGEYLFLSAGFGSSTEFMSANLQANSTYYVLIKAWTNGFGASKYYFKPVQQTGKLSDKVKNMLTHTRLVEKTAQSEGWLIDNLPNLKERKATYDKFSLNHLITHLQSSDGFQAR